MQSNFFCEMNSISPAHLPGMGDNCAIRTNFLVKLRQLYGGYMVAASNRHCVKSYG